MKYNEFDSPLKVSENINEELGWESAQQFSYERFLNKYFTYKPNDYSKIVQRFKFLIPGRLYTFKYDPLYKDKLDFYDTRPVILCFKNYIHPTTGNNLQLGINLNFIPSDMRLFVLEAIWKVFEKMIKQDLAGRKPKEGSIPNRQKLLFTDNYDVYGLLDYILQTIGKTGWKFAIRQYIFERISNLKWIDYIDWGYIPLLRAKDLIGISERELAKLYWSEKNRKGL